MYILIACGNSNMLQSILFIKKIINIVFIIAPLILVLFFTIDLAKNVFSKDDQENQKNLKLGIKRIIYSIVLMFVPLLVKTFMGMIDSYSKVANCYTIATDEKIQELKAKEDKEFKEKRQEQEKKRKMTAEEIEKEKKEEERRAKEADQKARREATERAREKNDNLNNSSSGLDLSGVSSSSEKIAKMAEYLAWPQNTSKSKLSYPYGRNAKITKWSQLTKGKPTKQFMDEMDRVYPKHFKWGTSFPAIRPGASCDTFVGVVVKASGYDTIGINHGQQHSAFTKHNKKWKLVKEPKRGDICRDSSHVKIYLGNGKIAQASYAGFFGRIDKGSCKSSIRIWRAIK